MADISITSSQKVTATVAAKDAAGADAPVDGAPVWAVQSGDVQIVPAADGMSASIISGAPGASVITVSADADLSGGFREIKETINVTVTPAEATSLVVSFGAPEQK